MAQYREVAIFYAQFDSDIDESTKALLKKGQLLTELLKQPQNSPLPVSKQIVSIFAGINGYMDDVDLKDVIQYETKLFSFLDSPLMEPFQPYLRYLHEDTSFTVDNTPIIDVLNFFTDYLYTDATWN